MIPEKLLEIMKKDGVVAIATLGEDGPHMVNSWNSYLWKMAEVSAPAKRRYVRRRAISYGLQPARGQRRNQQRGRGAAGIQEGSICSWKKAAERLFGYSATEALG